MIEMELKRIADALEKLVLGFEFDKAESQKIMAEETAIWESEKAANDVVENVNLKAVMVETVEKPKAVRTKKTVAKAVVAEVVDTIPQEPVAQEIVAQVMETVETVSVLTQDDMREKLKNFAGQFGIEKAKELLAKYKAGKVSELSAENTVKMANEMDNYGK